MFYAKTVENPNQTYKIHILASPLSLTSCGSPSKSLSFSGPAFIQL